MTTKQVKFFDGRDQEIHGGILIENETLICGCCGGMYDKNEWSDMEISILEEYDYWVNLEEEIMGD